jgi:hypothetical protein
MIKLIFNLKSYKFEFNQILLFYYFVWKLLKWCYWPGEYDLNNMFQYDGCVCLSTSFMFCVHM